MICDECKKKVYVQSISESDCEICSKHMITPHKPPYILCEECSVDYNRCRQCGRDIV